MPGFDGTGPLGEGPRTGRGLGKCPVNIEDDRVVPSTFPRGEFRRFPGRGIGRRVRRNR